MRPLTNHHLPHVKCQCNNRSDRERVTVRAVDQTPNDSNHSEKFKETKTFLSLFIFIGRFLLAATFQWRSEKKSKYAKKCLRLDDDIVEQKSTTELTFKSTTKKIIMLIIYIPLKELNIQNRHSKK